MAQNEEERNRDQSAVRSSDIEQQDPSPERLDQDPDLEDMDDMDDEDREDDDRLDGGQNRRRSIS